MVSKGGSKIVENNKLEVKKGREANMKTLSMVLLLCLGMFLIIGTGVAFAANEDTETQTSAVSLTIPHSAKLVISNSASSKVLNQDGDSETDFDAGKTLMPANTPNLKVSVNKNWQLSAKADAWVGPYAKAVGDLQLKHNGAYVQDGFASFTSLATTDQIIASNTIGVKNENYDCQYQILLDYTKDVPGVYTTTVTYTLVTLG